MNRHSPLSLAQRPFGFACCVLTAGWLALHGLYFLGTPIYAPPDTLVYDCIAEILLGRSPFPAEGLDYPPGYALAIATFRLVFGEQATWALVVAQHACVLLSAWMLLDLGWRVGYPRVGLLAAMLTVCNPALLTWSQTLYTEIFTSAALAVAVWAAVRAAGPASLNPWWALTAGAAVAYAGLLRQAPYVLAIPIAAYLFVQRRQTVGTARILAPMIPVAVTVLVFCVWSGCTFLHTGRFEHTTGAGRHVYNRVVYADRTLAYDAAATKELLSLVTESEAMEPHWSMFHRLQKRGLSAQQANQLMTQTTIEGMLHAPGKYTFHTVRLWFRYWFIEPDRLTETVRREAPIPVLGAALKPLITLLVYVTSHWLVGGMALLGACGALTRNRSSLMRLAFSVVGLYLLMHAAGEWVSSRFGIPVYPLLALLAGWGLLTGGRWVESRATCGLSIGSSTNVSTGGATSVESPGTDTIQRLITEDRALKSHA